MSMRTVLLLLVCLIGCTTQPITIVDHQVPLLVVNESSRAVTMIPHFVEHSTPDQRMVQSVTLLGTIANNQYLVNGIELTLHGSDHNITLEMRHDQFNQTITIDPELECSVSALSGIRDRAAVVQQQGGMRVCSLLAGRNLQVGESIQVIIIQDNQQRDGVTITVPPNVRSARYEYPSIHW